jgi:hypothetical protein
MKGSIHSAPQELFIIPVHVLAVTLHTRGVSSERRANLFVVLKPYSLPFVKFQPCWHHFKSGCLASRFVIYVSRLFLYCQQCIAKPLKRAGRGVLKEKYEYMCIQNTSPASRPTEELTEGGVDVLRSVYPFLRQPHCWARYQTPGTVTGIAPTLTIYRHG